MGTKEKMTSIGQPVPELPVAEVERPQQHYRDALGFAIGWPYLGKEIGGRITPECGDILSQADAAVPSWGSLGVR
jgi:hypothetical protein